PDMISCAKGITNGAVPMGAVAVRRGIYDAIVDSAPAGIELFHGYTYSGHPLATAAGLATLELYRTEGLFERALTLAPAWEEAAHALRGLPHVIDVRNLGLMAALELEPRPGAPGARGFDLFLDCFQHGALVRATGDVIAFSPPLIIERGQVDELFGLVADALRRLA
ncbi:MAG TPA: aminotransferase class III-fold pyridoxal phosphate-dependent enzyme, partial [Gemmatimonadales bacterium]